VPAILSHYFTLFLLFTAIILTVTKESGNRAINDYLKQFMHNLFVAKERTNSNETLKIFGSKRYNDY
jgi:hypothetical protein